MLQNSSEDSILAYMQQRIAKGGSFNPVHRYFDSKTVLHHAAIRGFDKLIKIFVEAKCPINARDRKGYSALMYAVTAGKRDTIAMLITLEADILVLTSKGSTLFDLAQENCCEHVVNGIKNLIDGTCDRGQFIARLEHHHQSKPFIELIEKFLGMTLEEFVTAQENTN